MLAGVVQMVNRVGHGLMFFCERTEFKIKQNLNNLGEYI